MSKIKIEQTKDFFGVIRWAVTTNSDTRFYETYEAACKATNKYLTRLRKEASAYSMLGDISINLLSLDEQELVHKLTKNKCRGISPRQYGYLKGIYTRQKRAW